MNVQQRQKNQRTGRAWLRNSAIGDRPRLSAIGDQPSAPDPKPETRNPEPMPLPLAQAEKHAAKILAELAPFCERIEIAGSIRRRRPTVNDIDFVALPHAGKVNALRERILRHTE